MKKMIFVVLAVVLLLAVSVCSAETEGDADLYDQAYGLYEEGKYFDAHELFLQSQYGDWERMAKKCVRRWPKNGVLYRDPSQWVQDTQLSFRVDQPKDSAVYIRILKDDKPVFRIFVGGKDTVSIMLPGNGTYVIQDGVGSEWYGEDDAFGSYGGYETMTFGPREEPFIYLESRLHYTITINVKNAIGEDVGSEDLPWEDFR